VARILAIQADNCTGCRMCELACSSFKEGEVSPYRSRVRVVADTLEGWSRPAVCLQCDDPMCMAVCPAGAIQKAATAEGDPFVEIHADKCIRCGRCSASCPFGAIVFSPQSHAVKCDLCGGKPKCVEFCFYDCLSFVEISDREYEKHRRKVKALTNKACREISRQTPLRRRAEFSLEASKVLATVLPTNA
jgi:carbon-monoxide dehydrogenase iron sulfur subunit